MSADGGVLFLLLLFGGGEHEHVGPPGIAPPKPALPPKAIWPSTPPTTLPPFPGPAWEFDEPPAPEVVTRAKELLATLWVGGAGTRRQELVGGRWITFVAAIVRGGSKGVLAYRVKESARPSVLEPTPPVTYAPTLPGKPLPALPAAPPGVLSPIPERPPTPPRGGEPGVVITPASYASSAVQITTIAQVQYALNVLGYSPPLKQDGILGPLTRTAVAWFQKNHPPLKVDAIPGPLTKAALANAISPKASA